MTNQAIAPDSTLATPEWPQARVIPLRAALYLRISKDVLRRGLGVARQEADCRELAARRGWPVAELYVDNDTSATRKGGRFADRPEFRRLLADIDAGRIQAVLAYDLDRLVRDPLEHEQFLLLCERAGMHHLATLADEVDIQTGEGLMVARIKAAVAAEEVRKMSKRIKRKMLEGAEAGRPAGGIRRFGYRYRDTVVAADGTERPAGPLVVVPEEAEVIREAARRVLEGRSLGAYARELRETGPPPVRGGTWRQTALRQILMGPAIAGLRLHQGAIMGEAAWEPIIPRETWEAVRAILTAPERQPSGNRRTYLLTGLVVCACGQKMSGRSGGHRGAGSRGYTCSAANGGCGKVGISATRLEELVVAAVFKATSEPQLADAQAEEAATGARRAELMAAIDAAAAKLRDLARGWARDELGREEWLEARRAVEARQDEARAALAELERREVRTLDRYRGEGLLEAAWPELSTEERRVVLSEAITAAVIHPVGTSGGHANFNPDRVDVDWRV
jgi:DNA invertase Pin-like site-specific DNA recombinase